MVAGRFEQLIALNLFLPSFNPDPHTDREPAGKRNQISKEKPPLEKHTSTETPSFDKDLLKEKLIAESMLFLFMLATQALASPVVVPGGSMVLPSHGNLLRSIMLPYYPTYPFTNWRLVPATSPVVIQIDVDYTCEKEVRKNQREKSGWKGYVRTKECEKRCHLFSGSFLEP